MPWSFFSPSSLLEEAGRGGDGGGAGLLATKGAGATTGGDAGATGGGDDAEIDLGDDDDDAFAERPVPTSVFGGTTTNKRDAADAELGAAERFKRARENA